MQRIEIYLKSGQVLNFWADNFQAVVDGNNLAGISWGNTDPKPAYIRLADVSAIVQSEVGDA